MFKKRTMAIHQCSHCNYESPFKSTFKRHLKIKHGVTQAGVESGVKSKNKSQQPNDTHSEAGTYDSQPETQSEADSESETRGDIFDRLSTDGSETDDERYSWRLDEIFSAAYDHFCEFSDNCNIADDNFKNNWRYMGMESKKRAMEKYALLKMKMTEVYIGLPDPDSVEENSEEENPADEGGEKSEDEADGDDGTGFLSIIKDFEDVLSEKEKGRLEQYEQEAVEEIFEEEERDVENDDSEVETENEESYERAHLQTQLKDLKKLKEAFKEEGEKYFQYCSRREITTLCRWCNYILREKYDMDKELFDKCRQKCHPHKSDIRDLAYSRYTPRYEKRRILQKNQVGEGIVNGMLPLILDTIKSLL